MGPLVSEREGSNPWADGVKPRRSKRSTRWHLATGEARCGGRLPVWSSVDQIDGGDALCAAGGLAHRVVQAVCAGVAGDDAGVKPGGGRSSGMHGNGVRRHGRGAEGCYGLLGVH